MSSIRPLATITVLAFVGVLLYMKINETEPVLPAGVEDWSVNDEVQFDFNSMETTSSPQMAVASADSTPAQDNLAPTFGNNASAAPSWSAPPADTSATEAAPPNEQIVSEAPVFGADTAIADLPDLPSLPSLPPAPSSAPTADSVVSTASPEVPNLGIPDIGDATLPSSVSQPMVVEPNVPQSPAAEPALPSTTVGGELTESTAAASPPVTPNNENPKTDASLFSTTRMEVQAALDRGELSQALLLLSDWYGDPSLTAAETQEVNTLLSQLAGSVIYSTEPRLEPPYLVQQGERLEEIAKKYNVPWQLLAKINGITSADQVQPGQKLKVVRGPFSAVIDMSKRRMTLMLDRRYAGQFVLDLDPSLTVEEGHWEVTQKLLTPANVSLPGASPTTPTEERSLMLANTGGGASQVAILKGAVTTNAATDPIGRVLRLQPNDAEEVFDILSLGSKVVIRR